MASFICMWVLAQIVDRVNLYINLTWFNPDSSVSSGQVHFFLTWPDSTLSLSEVELLHVSIEWCALIKRRVAHSLLIMRASTLWSISSYRAQWEELLTRFWAYLVQFWWSYSENSFWARGGVSMERATTGRCGARWLNPWNWNQKEVRILVASLFQGSSHRKWKHIIPLWKNPPCQSFFTIR